MSVRSTAQIWKPNSTICWWSNLSSVRKWERISDVMLETTTRCIDNMTAIYKEKNKTIATTKITSRTSRVAVTAPTTKVAIMLSRSTDNTTNQASSSTLSLIILQNLLPDHGPVRVQMLLRVCIQVLNLQLVDSGCLQFHHFPFTGMYRQHRSSQPRNYLFLSRRLCISAMSDVKATFMMLLLLLLCSLCKAHDSLA